MKNALFLSANVFSFAYFSNTAAPRSTFWGRTRKHVILCFALLSELNTQLQQTFLKGHCIVPQKSEYLYLFFCLYILHFNMLNHWKFVTDQFVVGV